MSESSSTNERLNTLEKENKRLRHSIEELSLLNEIAVKIGASNDADHIIHTIVKNAIRAVEADQGDIRLVKKDDEQDLSTLIRTSVHKEDADPYRINDSILGWMQIHKQPLLINHPDKDERFSGSTLNPKIKSLLCVPLMNRARLMGVLSVFNGTKKPFPFTEEDRRLLSIIASQSAQIIENARLLSEQATLLQMREELRLAQLIQASLLPEAHPEVNNYDIAGISTPAQTVGGDYFDVFSINQRQIALCVGDASGKGLPAALFISSVQATLQGQALWSPSVSLCLERVNHLLTQRTRRGFFVTLFYGVLDTETHKFCYGNAGHNRPLYCSPSGEIHELDLGDIMLGFKSDVHFRNAEIDVSVGDTLLIFSDGVTEARNQEGEEFGDERLQQILSTHHQREAQGIVDTVMKEILAFAGATPQMDDMTLLVVKRTA